MAHAVLCQHQGRAHIGEIPSQPLPLYITLQESSEQQSRNQALFAFTGTHSTNSSVNTEQSTELILTFSLGFHKRLQEFIGYLELEGTQKDQGAIQSLETS